MDWPENADGRTDREKNAFAMAVSCPLSGSAVPTCGRGGSGGHGVVGGGEAAGGGEAEAEAECGGAGRDSRGGPGGLGAGAGAGECGAFGPVLPAAAGVLVVGQDVGGLAGLIPGAEGVGAARADPG